MRCGHSFCRVCIDYELYTQEASGGYHCPQCSKKYKVRPGLQRNFAVKNIAECVQSTQSPLQLPETRSADLSNELECPLCLNRYRDPVSMRCGHSFCRVCIDHLLYTQEASGGYSCPQCTKKKKFKVRPTVQTNIALKNIAESFLLTQPPWKEAGVRCTYCVDSPVAAVKSCLMCDASLCDNHLQVHSKAQEHILCDPTTSLENRKCSVHKELLKFYCSGDSTCICVSCYVIGEHVGHKVMPLEEASKKKKEDLRKDLQKLTAEIEKTEKRVGSLEERRRKAQEKSDSEAERVIALFVHLRKKLEELEKSILSDIINQAEKMSLLYKQAIEQLELRKDELSKKVHLIQKLCNMMDPLTVIRESETSDLCDTVAGDNEGRERQVLSGMDLHVADISHTLHTGLGDVMYKVTGGICIQPADILLDVDTAGNILHVSDDKKTVSKSDRSQNYPETPGRFQYAQVLNSQSFSSGRHYWEVDVGRSDNWIVGLSYPSIERRGNQSLIGGNNKSWCLYRASSQYSARHDKRERKFLDNIPSDRVRIYLDYEAGQISFYALCDSIRHIHTFTATFTEPLLAAIGVGKGCVTISEVNHEMWATPTGDI
ncbi:E3 ubiquitin-protein ligase TRIM7-like [Hyperolius riggenbachi]|uniref:E3 ubiquitin-protein ligase TRIM7-like n=1 Tax=Hyperolius riggenbachi TaxID=752182 RepID=UPI0035A2CE15